VSVRLSLPALLAERDRYGYQLRGEVEAWWGTPVDRRAPARDEVAIKVALAVSTPGVDAAAVIQGQRRATLDALQAHTRLKRQIPDPAKEADLAHLLLIDHLIFATEAEARWLDVVEQRLAARARKEGLP
jgi:predicted PP-loop superfamily ATPase